MDEKRSDAAQANRGAGTGKGTTPESGATNLAILLGLEFDAELARERAIVQGRPPSEEPYVEPRDTRTWPPRLRALRAARARTTPSRDVEPTG